VKGRRRLVVLVSALLMLAIGGGLVGAFVAATQGEDGRDWIRRLVQAQLARTVQGSFHIGRLSGSFITDLTIDSVEIRDPDDSLFVASGPVSLTFDPRDLMDGRLFIRSVDVTRPRFATRRDQASKWTHDKIWPKRGGPKLPRSRTAFGSLLVLEQVRISDGSFALSMPWSPDDSLRGVRRDSAVAVALADSSMEVRRLPNGRFHRTWRWTGLQATVPRLRLAYPDSTGRRFDIARLDVDESNPPFRFRELTGQVRWVGDSIWFDLPHFRLPASRGHATGKVWWGNDQPMRYRVRVVGDSVSLSDVAWITPSLPTEGGGTMTLDIRDARGIRDGFEYALSDVDVRSHRSRIRGRMTWIVGGPVLELRDVDLEAAPVDFALLERFNTQPFPYPFAGTITGRMRGRGGPLNNFVVDEARVLFRDANVPGAVGQGTARGTLDILQPAFTRFLGFTVALDSFDLRTPQFLNPDFPRLAGRIAGSVVLDSSWLDVRFRDADLTHRDGDLPESRFRGTGRLTSGETAMAYDVDMIALPLSFTTLAHSFPAVTLRGDFSGMLRARGTLDDLIVESDLSGESGRLEANVRMDAEAPRFRLTGRGATTALDPRAAFEDARYPTGELSARVVVDLAGDSLADLTGRASVSLDRSTLDGVRFFAGEGRFRFDDGKAFLDSLRVESTALEFGARGAIGLHAARSDSISFSARIDSLGGLRRWVTNSATDSLAGGLQLDGVTRGWVRDFALDARLNGSGFLVGSSTARQVTGSAALSRLPETPTGELTLAADTAVAAGFGITRAFARARLDGSGESDVDLQFAGRSGTLGRGRAHVVRLDDSTRVRLDSLVLATALQRWELPQSATFAFGTSGFAVDSFALRGTSGASVRLAGSLPETGPVDLRFGAAALPIADLAELLQISGAEEGRIELSGRLQGTRSVPQLNADAALNTALVWGVRLDSLRANVRADADQLEFTASLGDRTRPAMRADGRLPYSLGLDGGRSGLRDAEPIRATVRSDTVSLRLFAQLAEGSASNAGDFALNLDVGGTWRRPRFDGALLVRNGNLRISPLGDVRWRDIAADVQLAGDSIAIRRLSATSSTAGRGGRASVSGWIRVADRENPTFDVTVRANTFHVYNVRDVADIDLSDSLRFTGALTSAVLRGALTADRAIVSIPEIATKNVISLEEFDRFGIADSLETRDQGLVPRRSSVFLENLTVRNVPVRMGRDVWLRSAEANINLGGAVSITQGQITRGRNAGQRQLALTGALQTVRGSYRLNVGPVQRTFEVEQGEIRWFGDPDEVTNPSLDIAALHTIRQYSKQGSQPDVRVRVNLGGTLLEPTAVLSTPDSARVKNADLISYLVTGGPSFEIGARGSEYYANTTYRVLLSTFSSVLGGKLAGGVCDDAQLSTSGVDGIRGGTSVIEGTRFNCAKQVGNKAFVRLDAGLCQVGNLVNGTSGAASAFAQSIGVKLDYLLGRGFTVSGGVEPPTNSLLCTQSVNAQGFVPTPQQFGLDLFRAWRF